MEQKLVPWEVPIEPEHCVQVLLLFVTTQEPGIGKDSPVCTPQNQGDTRACRTGAAHAWLGTGMLTGESHSLASPHSATGPLVAVHLVLTWENENLEFLWVVLGTTPSSPLSLPLAYCFLPEDRPEHRHTENSYPPKS